MAREEVVLVNEQNEVLGTMEKYAAHSDRTPLHRAFSSFIFHPQKGLLIQQRSHKKKTWPLMWSNSCCGHPSLDETPASAARRRLEYELGITDVALTMVLPKYRYTCELYGIVENEICPVLTGVTVQEPIPNPEEVETCKWLSWKSWLKEIEKHPDTYSFWCREETQLLEASPLFHSLLLEYKAIK
ncbi:MAG: isopentenyl-diphosphate Delta-isomerase [Patescibacteria group bacterium]